ncbi:hypothetical protein Y032_0316g2287 [Ancylostoma ceylanicum]|nr:hypothetical protein Y032_0316g2287 [Ancylostoma ceylanicum]
MEDYAFFFRLTTLLELLSGQCLRRISQADLRTWTGRIVNIATVVFDGASGQAIDNSEEGRIRFDLSGNFYLFECNRCPHVTFHFLRVHLKHRCGFLMHYPAMPLINFSTPEATAIFAMEKVWIGVPRLPTPLLAHETIKAIKPMTPLLEPMANPPRHDHPDIFSK